MKRIIFNQKGGVGKTSVTCNLAAAFARSGRRVLVIDLDSQGNTSSYLGGNALPETAPTIADFFEATLSFKLFKDSLKECVFATPYNGLWLVPADRSLAELQPKLEARYKVFKLRDALNEIIASMEIDEVLIDTPPAMNFYTMSALMAAERVLIPFDCDAFSANALVQVAETVAEVAADHNPDLAIEGVVINHFQPQAKLPLDAIADLASRGFNILKPYLSSSIVMRESHAARVPLVSLKPKHKLSQEFSSLADNLL